MMHKRKYVAKKWLILSIAICVIIGAAFAAFVIFGSQPLVPPAIRKAQTSTLYVPAKETAQADASSFKYDKSQMLTTYGATFNGVGITISEQPSPDIFADITDAYQKLINGLNNYATFDSANGTVYLTRPPNQDNKQAAVMNAKGTLMFIKADKDLSNDQWKQLFNNLNIVK